jgi:hypothetical protein
MGVAQLVAVCFFALLFVVAYRRGHYFRGLFYIIVAFSIANCVASAAERPRMPIAVIIDTDLALNDPQGNTAMIEVNRSLALLASQAGIDITVKVVRVGEHIADHTNPTALTDAVRAYYYAQGFADQGLGVALFLTQRRMAVGSKRLRGFTWIGGAYTLGGATVQMMYDGFDYQTIAHELAHTLNAPHDGEGACTSETSAGIMSSTLSGSEYFTECALREMKAFIDRQPTNFYPKPAAQTTTTATPATGGGGSLSWWFCGVLGALVIAQHYRVRRWKREAAKQARAADVKAVALVNLRADYRALRADLERLRYKLGVEVGIGVREHINANAGGVYECGEGYAHPIGQACTGQCVLRG